MQTSSRLSTATHMMILIYMLGDKHRLTSESIAKSVQVNPVMIRRLLGSLKEAGLVSVAPGKGGAKALKNAEEVTLWDLYAAVEAPAEECVFGFHDCDRSHCPVAKNMHAVLDKHLQDAQDAMRESLQKVTMADICRDMIQERGVTAEKLLVRLDV